MKQILRSAMLAMLLALPAIGAVPPATIDFPLFADGDRVVFAGDSITAGGKWHLYIADFYLTRFPGRKIVWSNAGVSGDSAGGVIARFDRDVLRDQPNRAVVMLGMNDVGSTHFVANATSEQIQGMVKALDRYHDQMGILLARFAEKSIPIILVTPTPFDETVRVTAVNQPGRNDALASVAEFVRATAVARGLPLVEFHRPMTALNAKLQAADPTASLIGKDRTHPGDVGHLVMAALFLQAQHAPALVASVEVDAPSVRCMRQENCAVTDLVATNGGLSFDYFPRARPFPYDEIVRQADALVGFVDSLNREELRVTGLGGELYVLQVDGKTVGTFSATTLARGLNLAPLPTPMGDESRALTEMNHRRGALVMQLRAWEWVCPKFVAFGVASDDLVAIRRRRDEMIASPGVRSVQKYFETQLDAYLERKPREREIRAEIEEFTRQIAAFPPPGRHRVELRPASAATR
jgi:lysophospholipase L1-like esterase